MRHRKRARERERTSVGRRREISNSKTLFFRDCAFGLLKSRRDNYLFRKCSDNCLCSFLISSSSWGGGVQLKKVLFSLSHLSSHFLN